MAESTNGNMGPESYHVVEFVKWLNQQGFYICEFDEEQTYFSPLEKKEVVKKYLRRRE